MSIQSPIRIDKAKARPAQRVKGFTFEPITLEGEEADRCLQSYGFWTPFQTSAWMHFLEVTQHGRPILLQVRFGNEPVGCFVAMIVRKFGFSVLGSPFPGWSTPYMGLNLAAHVNRLEVTQALQRFAFRELTCAHMEMLDRGLSCESVQQLGYRFTPYTGYEIDLQCTDSDLFSRMTHQCRSNVRKAQRSGVTIERANDDTFADEYYDQLVSVFERQQLAPPYPRSRIHELIRFLGGTDMFLGLRARDASGRSIATSISFGGGGGAYLWGLASWRELSAVRPIEALVWQSMCHWREAGARFLDMGGSGDYKRKFGGRAISIPWFRASRYPALEVLRSSAERATLWTLHYLRRFLPDRDPHEAAA